MSLYYKTSFRSWRQGTGSGRETMNLLNHEPSTILVINEPALETTPELNNSVPGMWWFPSEPDHRCIYRVPHRLRRVNPEAYTPQLLIIGPLHHSLKSQAIKYLSLGVGDIASTKLMGYLNMEEQKRIYLSEFARRIHGLETIDGFRRIIKENEYIIRASYSESTTWIESSEFVDMILHDSVFILEFLLRDKDYTLFGLRGSSGTNQSTWDPIFEQPWLQTTVEEDLILLENQLPYFILEKLFGPIVPILRPKQTLREIVITHFRFQGNIRDDSSFKHFTDLFRCVRVETLKSKEKAKSKWRSLAGLFRLTDLETNESAESEKIRPEGHRALRVTQATKKSAKEETHLSKKTNEPKIIKHMYNAAKLHSAGVKFEAVTDEFSIDVQFENGCLKIPCLWVPDDVEITLRNIMALEQCHYPFKAYVCNFVSFLDFLIDTEKDVELLMENGILNNWGEKSTVAVAEMVNTLFSGVVEHRSYYAGIASRVNAYYENPVNRSRTILLRQYFGNLWRCTATIAATLLLVMTLSQTVTSIIQVLQN